MSQRSLFVLAALLLFSSEASAFEWTLHGAVKNETAYFVSGEKRFDKVQNSLDLKPEAVLSDRLEFRGRLLTWYDAAMDIEATNTTDLTPSIKKHYRTYARAKEAYFLYAGDAFDLRLGQQQIVWGKTDGLRMLDIINPLDLREFILDDFLNSRIGLVAARLNYYTYLGDSEHEFEFIVIPDTKVVEPAPAGSRWGFARPALPAAVTPVFQSGSKPGWAAENTGYGAAWRSNLSGWDLSLNWFYGWKGTPNIEKNQVGTVMYLKPVYSQMHTAGGSFSNAFGPWVVRGEVATNLNEALDTSGVTVATSITKQTTFNGAIGVDYTANNWTVNPQLFLRHIHGWSRDILEDQNSGFVSLRVATDYMNEKLKPEVIGLYSWSDRSWMLRPKASYEFSDHIKATAGVDLFGGRSSAFFGQFADNDRIYTEIEYSF
ncbi:MAG: hypothetical protein K9M17_05285 [Mariprofundaceae bacterium]|nr:hypothetical protein [Mariprofundaceae bacterium]